MVNKFCLYCGKKFTAKRNSALYCSTNCRVQYNHLPDTMKQASESARENLQKMYDAFHKNESLGQDYDIYLSHIQQIVIQMRKELKRIQTDMFIEKHTTDSKIQLNGDK